MRKFVLELPLVRGLRRRFHRWYFLSDRGLFSFHGVYGSFDEARKDLPRSAGFEGAPLIDHYVRVRCQQVFPYDYPVMFWLERAFVTGARRILDIGGSVGVHYYGYRRYLSYPGGLVWFVEDLPSVTAVGREVATREGAKALQFLDSLDVRELEADVWISSGSIHYIEKGRPSDLLSEARAKPSHVLLNKLPLYDGDDYVTTQSLGDGCYAPLHVYCRGRLIDDIERVGYQLVDCWSVPERSQYVSGHAGKSFDHYSGLYFRCSPGAGNAARRHPPSSGSEASRS